MKRKILEITEIDCGDETCDGCDEHRGIRNNDGLFVYASCFRLNKVIMFTVVPPATRERSKRLPECLEAERRYDRTLEVDERPWEEGLEPEVTHVTVTPDPKDSIGE